MGNSGDFVDVISFSRGGRAGADGGMGSTHHPHGNSLTALMINEVRDLTSIC